jgi:hypothetical protein
MSANGFEPGKLLLLLRHPGNSRRLEPADDWLYGVIGAAIGVAGFALWAWAEQSGIRSTLSFFGSLLFSTALQQAIVGELIWLGILSIILLTALLAIAGNRMGGRKRNWMEAIAYCGGAQVWFGAAFAVCAIVGLVLWKVSLVLAVVLLLLDLNWLTLQAMELHAVEDGKRLQFLCTVLGIYASLMALALSGLF